MNHEQNVHEPLVERALVGLDLAAENHIANCEPCQVEREKMEDALRQFGAANREYAMRPESFWHQQALRIEAARRKSETRSRLTATLVPAVIVLLVAAFAVLDHAPHRPPVATAKPAVQVDPDHELLVGVERTIQADTPLALEPATLMVDERDSSVPLSSTPERKEIRSNAN